MKAFIDTGFFVAQASERDQHHALATGVDLNALQLFTSSAIINETITLLQRRGHFSFALEFLRGVRMNDQIRVVAIDAVIQARAWDRFAQWGAFGADATDCSSFAVMTDIGIRHALCFDAHFRKAGFETFPALM